SDTRYRSERRLAREVDVLRVQPEDPCAIASSEEVAVARDEPEKLGVRRNREQARNITPPEQPVSAEQLDGSLDVRLCSWIRILLDRRGIRRERREIEPDIGPAREQELRLPECLSLEIVRRAERRLRKVRDHDSQPR